MTSAVKTCWVATETAKGWRVKLGTSKGDFNIVGLLVKTEADIKRLFKGSIVFVHLKNSNSKR